MIFVSYSDLDRERVEPLVIDLGVLGHNVYFEDKGLGGTRRWDDIFTSIEQADALVYTLTRNTQASYSRLLEYEHALALGKPIISVRLEPIDIWSLPPGINAILDYPPQDAAAQEEFARVFSALPPVGAPPAVARPEVSFALAQLADHINLPSKSAAVKSAIFLNLREFLERRETFVPAETLLGGFASQLARTDPLASDVNRLQSQIRHSSTGRGRPLFWRRRAFGGLLFSMAVAAALVLALRAFSESKLPGDPPSATQDPPVTATLVSLSIATNTVTLTDIPLATPTEAPSEALLIDLSSSSFDPTDRSPNSDPPSDPPSATQSPPSATPPPTSTLPPSTSTPLPTSTLPPTNTSQPPTNTAIPILPTSIPIIPTVVKILPTLVPILPTAKPPTPQPPPTNQPPATPQPPPTQKPPPTSVPIIPTVVKILPTLVPILPTAKPPTPQPPPTNQPPATPQPPSTQKPPPTPQPPPTQKPQPTNAPIIPPIVPTVVHLLPTPNHGSGPGKGKP